MGQETLPDEGDSAARANTWASGRPPAPIEREADLSRFGAGDQVAGQQQALRPLRAHVVDPHVGRRATLGPDRGEADLGVFAAITRSQCWARSVPPATQNPCT